MICEYYTPEMKLCYHNIGKKEDGDLSPKKNDNLYLLRFLSEIRNILSCLKRLFESDKHLGATEDE